MRTRIVFLILLIGLFALPDSCRTGDKTQDRTAPAPKDEFQDEQMELLEAHNKQRISRGFGPLAIDRVLCDYAERHAGAMASKGRLFHSSMGDLQDFCGAETVGENIAWGQESVDDVVSDWMWSPGHRWNILGSSYAKVGFGVKKDAAGRRYWCVVFSS